MLSFVYVGIYWNNHHHMLHACRRVSGGVLWANLHLLFWLSLVPFVTGWMGENHFAPLPVAVYGVVLLMSALAYLILQRSIIRRRGPRLAARSRGRRRPEGERPVGAVCRRDAGRSSVRGIAGASRGARWHHLAHPGLRGSSGS